MLFRQAAMSQGEVTSPKATLEEFDLEKGCSWNLQSGASRFRPVVLQRLRRV